jgi:hypothetical protein
MWQDGIAVDVVSDGGGGGRWGYTPRLRYLAISLPTSIHYLPPPSPPLVIVVIAGVVMLHTATTLDVVGGDGNQVTCHSILHPARCRFTYRNTS